MHWQLSLVRLIWIRNSYFVVKNVVRIIVFDICCCWALLLFTYVCEKKKRIKWAEIKSLDKKRSWWKAICGSTTVGISFDMNLAQSNMETITNIVRFKFEYIEQRENTMNAFIIFMFWAYKINIINRIRQWMVRIFHYAEKKKKNNKAITCSFILFFFLFNKCVCNERK